MKRKDLEVALRDQAQLAIRVRGSVRQGMVKQIGVSYSQIGSRQTVVSEPRKQTVLVDVSYPRRIEEDIVHFGAVLCSWQEWLKDQDAGLAEKKKWHDVRMQRLCACEASAAQITAEFERVGLPLRAELDGYADGTIKIQITDRDVEAVLAWLAKIPAAS